MTEHQAALDWIKAEHDAYQGDKFDQQADDDQTHDEWTRKIDMYLNRAEMLGGLDNPLGRQAIAKAAATTVGYLESVFRVYGSVPSPGFTSGEHKGDFKMEGGDTDNESE